jgi:hypothetical protein
MKLIYFVGLGLVVYLNLVALTLAAGRFVPSPAIARAAALAGLCTTLFFVEHFVGLGRLEWALPPLTAVALWLVWRRRARLLRRDVIASELVFLAAVAYGLAWKLARPEIVESYDQLSDLHLVANYLPGARLPPVDFWLPWQRLDYYYALQHYAAALFGRLTGLGPGTCFNIGIVLLAALVITLAWDFAASVGLRFAGRLLAVFCLVVGGTGVAPLFHLITAPMPPGLSRATAAELVVRHNFKFVGWFEDAVASPLWRRLVGEGATPRGPHLPLETFGQQFPLGGFHAPLSGFFLLFLALAIIAFLWRGESRARPVLEAILGFTVPLTLCCNAWTFPLQAALVVVWKLWDTPLPRLRDLRFLAIGAGLGLFLILPFLGGFAVNGRAITLTRVRAGEHTPALQFLIVHWPLLGAALLAPFAGRLRPLALFFATLFVPLLAATELFNAFDPGYYGDMIRFNPAMKWWGWIFSGGVFALSTCLLASERRVARLGAVVVLLLLSLYAVDVARFWVEWPRAYAGRLDGRGFYAADPANGRMLQYLVDAPPGIVLEKVYDERPIDAGIYAGFAVKPVLVGVPWILRVLKTDLTELPGLLADIASFYAGRHPDAARFLAGHDVRYVVWSQREGPDLQTWAAIDQAIAGRYRWVEFSPTADRHVGLWIRRD